MYPLLQPTGLLSVPQSKFQLIFANEDGFTLRGSQLVRWIYQLGVMSGCQGDASISARGSVT